MNTSFSKAILIPVIRKISAMRVYRKRPGGLLLTLLLVLVGSLWTASAGAANPDAWKVAPLEHFKVEMA